MTSHCNNKTLFLIERGTNIHFIGLQDGDAHDQNRKNETWHTLANNSGSIDLGIWASIYNFGDKWHYNTIHQTSFDAFKMNESPISLKLILNQFKTLYFSSFFWNKIRTFLSIWNEAATETKNHLDGKTSVEASFAKISVSFETETGFFEIKKSETNRNSTRETFFSEFFFDIPMRN